jgi:gephyrin
LTVSDRASSGGYETGDLSGPAVQEAVAAAVASYGDSVTQKSTETAIVPDNTEAIQSKLKEWADNAQLDLILTTGGTGFSPRDVTPEATNNVVDRICGGLVSFCTMECAKFQPLASLSRGTAGTRGKTLIVNLPGNPKGVQEIIPVLLPLALHAISDMSKGQ